jgi:hypothetical protein
MPAELRNRYPPDDEQIGPHRRRAPRAAAVHPRKDTHLEETMKTILSILALSLVLCAPVVAQQDVLRTSQPIDSLQELRLGDGSRHVGHVVELHADRLVFETIAGVKIEANRAFSRVRNVRGRIVEGEFWPEDRNATRLFFAPTGRALRQGEGYAGVFVFLPFVAVGATDDISIAGGVPPVGSLDQVPVWIAPKARVLNLPNTQVSAGLFALHLPGEEDWDYNTGTSTRGSGEIVGLVYSVATFGDMDRAVHAGAGIAFGGGDGIGSVPMMVGGELRVSRRNKLITENWLFPGEGGALTGGVRMMGDRWTTDLGLAALLGDGDVPYFPIVSFSYSFGKR